MSRAAPLRHSLREISLPIRTDRLELRLPAPRDLTVLVRLLRDPAIVRWTGRIPPRIPSREVRGWIARARPERRRGASISLVLVPIGSDAPIGVVGVRRTSREEEGDLGYWIGRPYRGQGFASEAVRAVAGAAFREARLHRLTASIFPGNVASESVLRRVGFRWEGRSRRSFKKFGIWRDELHFGLFPSELR